jgi:hypothetical protein
MKTWILLTPLTVGLLLTVTPVFAQSGAQPVRSNEGRRADIEHVQKALKQQGHDPGRIDGVMGSQTTEPRPTPSSTQTGGTTRPSAVDPAQAHKTGGNVGDGASYSRSTEKGQSTMKDADKNK